MVAETLTGYRGSRVLVLGGLGFLGSRIARRATALGAGVTVIDALVDESGANRANLHGLPAMSPVTVIEADVCALGDLGQRLKDADVIFDAMGTTGHQWAYRHPDLDLAANVGSHLAVLRAAADAGAAGHLVHLGTRAVYGRATGQPLDETAARQPIDIQGHHKLVAEHHIELLASRTGLRATILRVGNCYGPGQRLSGTDVGLIGGFFRELASGRQAVVYGGPDRHRDFLFADDLADAALAAGVEPTARHRVFNIAGRRERLMEVAEQILSHVGRGSVEVEPFPDDVSRMDPGDLQLDCSLAQRVLRWTPKTPLAEGIKATTDYYGIYARSYGLSD